MIFARYCKRCFQWKAHRLMYERERFMHGEFEGKIARRFLEVEVYYRCNTCRTWHVETKRVSRHIRENWKKHCMQVKTNA